MVRIERDYVRNKATAPLLSLLLVFMASCSMQTRDAYQAMIDLYPIEALGRGPEPTFTTIADQPMTYALILSSESIHYAAEPSDEIKERIIAASNWLINHFDEDHDGLPGWGLPDEWDAFQDGSSNPANMPYTITTALVLDSFLDLLSLPELLENDAQAFHDIISEVFLVWNSQAWSCDEVECWYWYSLSENDSAFVTNVNAMMAGVQQRYLNLYGSRLSTAERELIQTNTDAVVEAIIGQTVLRDGSPYWSYIRYPNEYDRQGENDLLHHAYTIWGLELYRENGGSHALPWSRQASLQSLESFWRGDQLMRFPQNVDYEDGKGDRLPRNWSVGMAFACASRWALPDAAGNYFTVLQNEYGPFPLIRYYPNSEDQIHYPRFTSHVLLGLAYYLFY